MLTLSILILGVCAGVYFYRRDRRHFDFPERPGVYSVSTVRNQKKYNLFAYFDGLYWCEPRLSYAEARDCLTRSKRGYYWAFCKLD